MGGGEKKEREREREREREGKGWSYEIDFVVVFPFFYALWIMYIPKYLIYMNDLTAQVS